MKRFFSLVFVVAAIFIVVSCGSAAQTQPQQIRQGDPINEFIREVRRNTPENAILGIGSSNHSNRNRANSTAEQRARAQVTRQIESVVSNMVIDYSASSEAQPQALLQFSEEVSRTLAQQTLRGATIPDQIYENGESVVVVMITAESFRNGVINASRSAAALAPHMANAQWALERMDNALKANNMREPVVQRND